MTSLMTTLSPVMRTEHRVTHALVEYCDLLLCPWDEMERRVVQEVERNPALELTPVDPWSYGGWTPIGDADEIIAETDRNPSPLSGVLLDAVADLGSSERPIAEWILDDLDERGFLAGGAEHVSRALGIPLARVRRVIEVLRSAGPPGLCAGDLAEFLLLQLAEYERSGTAPVLARRLIGEHLAELGSVHLRGLAAAVGRPAGEVAAAREFIRTSLRPPAALRGTGPIGAAGIPDLVLRCPGPDDVEVTLVGDPASRLRVDPFWTEPAASVSLTPLQRRTLVEQARQARSFVGAVTERAVTLRRIAGYAASRQREFLRTGPQSHQPLTRAEVAGALDLHESTVSRAVSGKRVRLPNGRTVHFSTLFGSTGSVHAALRAVVAAERHPLSDTRLATELGRRGFPVARRTVAKYRRQLGIAVAERRLAR